MTTELQTTCKICQAAITLVEGQWQHADGVRYRHTPRPSGEVTPLKHDARASPIYHQYTKLKEQYPECLLLFRFGDFYELYFGDVILASKVLGLTVTTRTPKGYAPMQMAGFPHHALNAYLRKLVASGHRVAICEMEKTT